MSHMFVKPKYLSSLTRVTKLLTKLIFLQSTLMLSGCINYLSVEGDDIGSRWLAGITKVESKQDSEFISGSEVSNLGLWIESSGFGVGYRRDEKITATKDCKVVFMIRNVEQLQNAIHLVKSELSESSGDICALLN